LKQQVSEIYIRAVSMTIVVGGEMRNTKQLTQKRRAASRVRRGFRWIDFAAKKTTHDVWCTCLAEAIIRACILAHTQNLKCEATKARAAERSSHGILNGAPCAPAAR
jgi:hypothetical protein